MEEKMIRRQIRRSFRPEGWSLVVYYLILNVMVMAVVFVDMMICQLQAIISGGTIGADAIAESAMNNAWGYIAAGGIGLVILLCWKGGDFWKNEIWAKGKPMKPGDFFAILTVFIGCQLAATVGATVLEAILNQFGLSAMEAMQSASPSVTTLSMFLYMAIWAPFSEEVLFRGFLQRLMMPYGKRFAIFASSFLFGIFHGNLIQTPYAFLVGLVLGYVASEYSIAWAMLLHMINNMVLGDSLMRVTSGLPEEVVNVLLLALTGACALAGIIILVRNRQRIRSDLGSKKTDRRVFGCFFSNAGVIVMTVISCVSMVLMLVAA